MKNIIIGVAIGVIGTVGLIALAGFYRFNFTDGGDMIPLPPAPPEPFMTEADARTVAESSCIKGGEALGPGSYNPNSKTWWFDANLNATQPGCNPACVVSEATLTAEINWRCTGLVPPEEDTVPGTPIVDTPVTKAPTDLLGKTWILVNATRANGTVFIPQKQDTFTLTFEKSGTVSIGTDCNSMGGEFEISGSSFVFKNTISTMMFCEGSEEGEFSELLAGVTSYQISSGALTLENKVTGIVMRFK